MTEQLGLFESRGGAASRRPRAGAAQRPRKPPGALSDAAPVAAAHARARRAARHARRRGRRIRPRAPAVDRRRAARARGVPPAAPRRAADARRAAGDRQELGRRVSARPAAAAVRCRAAGCRARGDDARCRSARRATRRCASWLLDEADYHLAPWLLRESQVVGRRPAHVQVRLQRTRWGSCSNSGTVSLNAALLFLEPAVVRYLFVHELCHLIALNHSRTVLGAPSRASSPTTKRSIGGSRRRGTRFRSGLIRGALKRGGGQVQRARELDRASSTAIVYGFLLLLAECGRILRAAAARC